MYYVHVMFMYICVYMCIYGKVMSDNEDRLCVINTNGVGGYD